MPSSRAERTPQDSGIRRTVVPCLWPGGTIVIAATGDSLRQEDLDLVRDAHVPLIVINDAYQPAPWADVIYSPDSKWWKWQKQDGVDEASFPPRRYTLDWIACEYYPSIVPLAYLGALGLSADPTGLFSGGHAGYQAINLAAHLVGDRSRIILLGYDMQPGPDGANHFFGEHRDRSTQHFAQWLKQYPSLVAPLAARTIDVINATRRTALHTFPRMPLARALQRYHPQP